MDMSNAKGLRLVNLQLSQLHGGHSPQGLASTAVKVLPISFMVLIVPLRLGKE